MRTNYSTATSARPENAETSENGTVSRRQASARRKPSVIDRDFSESDAWPMTAPLSTEVVSASPRANDASPETDSSHQGYFAEWINEAEDANTESWESVDDSIAAPESEIDLAAVSPIGDADLPDQVDFGSADLPTPEMSIQERALQRLAASTGKIPKVAEAPTQSQSEVLLSGGAGVDAETSELVAAHGQADSTDMSADAFGTAQFETNGFETNAFETESFGSMPIEELARQTGGYEALAPELLAVEQPETVALDQELLAHDPTYGESLEKLTGRENGRQKNRDKLGRDKIKASKVLEVFDRQESGVPAMTVRTVDHPHMLVDRHVPLTVSSGADGNPTRKAVVLGLVAVVAIAAVGVSFQRSQASRPVFEVAPATDASPGASGAEPRLLLDQAPPEVTTTTVAPATTTTDSGPDLEARKAPLVAIAGESTTTTEQPTTTVAPATTATAATETEIVGTDETVSAEATTTSLGEGVEATDTTVDVTTTDASTTTVADGSETTVTTVEVEETTTTTEAETAEVVPASTDEAWVDAGNGVALPAVLLDIRYCESRGDYLAANSRSTARGAFQFLTGSWKYYGHAERYGVAQAHLATPAQQDEAALKTWQADGTRPWNASKSCWSKNPVA